MLLNCFGMQTHLALSCKALLPILGMGHVRVNLGKSGRPLLSATRCLTKMPCGASHLDVFSWVGHDKQWLGTRHLIDLRCAHAPMWCWCMHACGHCLCCAVSRNFRGWNRCDNAAVCFCSLLTNLRKLTLYKVAVSLPALQPVATRLHELHMPASCLQGRSDGFLTRG